MTVYQFVTNDKYELPLAQADTPEELAKICGVSPSCVYAQICRNKKGLKSRYISVEISDDDFDDDVEYEKKRKKRRTKKEILNEMY